MAKSTCSAPDCDRPTLSRGWCGRHYQAWAKYGDPQGGQPSPETRFWARVDKGGPVPDHRPDLGPCWIWTGGLHPRGYGAANFRTLGALAHRVAYKLLVGPIPDSLTLDHLCHNDSGCAGGPSCPHRRCVNPAHLEPVTGAENIRRGESPMAVNARKTHCPKGHEYTPENTYMDRGARLCRTCVKARTARYRQRRKAANN